LKLNKTKQYVDDKHYKNITVMIYMLFVQYMKPRMQITQERDFMTNSLTFMQQTTSPLSKGDSSVCN